MISLLILFFSCGEFQFSPYWVEIENTNLNEKNLDRILKPTKELRVLDEYKFAVISDTHDYYDGLEEQIKYLNSRKTEFDFLIITGDMTNVGLVSEYEETKKRLKKLKIPFLTTSGNHDLLIDGEKIYSKVFGKDTYSFEYKNTKFILYNNNNWESSSKVPDINWLEHELFSNSQEYLIVLSHVAPNDQDRFKIEEINTLKELLNRSRVNLYINGHNHNPGESKFGDTNHLTVGASSKDVLLKVTINSKGISHEFIKL